MAHPEVLSAILYHLGVLSVTGDLGTETNFPGKVVYEAGPKPKLENAEGDFNPN